MPFVTITEILRLFLLHICISMMLLQCTMTMGPTRPSDYYQERSRNCVHFAQATQEQNRNGFTGNGWESTGSDFRCQHYHCSVHQQLMQPTDHSITVYLQLTNVHTNQIFCSNANSQHINISCHQSPMLSTLATGTKLTEYGHRNQRRYHYKSVDE